MQHIPGEALREKAYEKILSNNIYIRAPYSLM